MKTSKAKDAKIVMGNLNAKVGQGKIWNHGSAENTKYKNVRN